MRLVIEMEKMAHSMRFGKEPKEHDKGTRRKERIG